MNKFINKDDKKLTEAEIIRKLKRSAINSSQEYELIVTNLEQQNVRLLQDREQLTQKVKQLYRRQKQIQHEQQVKQKTSPTVYYHAVKKQLAQGYKQLQLYQKKCYNSLNKNAINIQLRQLTNKYLEIQQKVQLAHQQLIDEKKTQKQLQKSIKGQLKILNKNIPQFEQLQLENKQIKKKIWNMRIVDDLTEHIQIRVQDNYIGLQQKGKFFQKLSNLTVQQVKRQKIKSKLQIVHNDHSRINIINNTTQRQRGARLKTQTITSNSRKKLLPSKYESAKTSLNLTLTKKQQQTMNQDNNMDNLIRQKQDKLAAYKITRNQLQQQLQQLLKLKPGLLQAYSLQKQVLAKQELLKANRLQKQQRQKMKEFCDASLQVKTEYEDTQPLRIDGVGTLWDISTNQNQQHFFLNDRMLLRQNKNVSITGLLTYQNKYGLVMIRASYSSSKVTPIYDHIPQRYLQQRCKMRKILLSDPKDYLQWFKIYHNHKDNRIVRLQIFSHHKIKFEAGKSKQDIEYDDTIQAYKIDNIGQQIPVCLVSTYKQVQTANKNYYEYVVSGLGFEINFKQ